MVPEATLVRGKGYTVVLQRDGEEATTGRREAATLIVGRSASTSSRRRARCHERPASAGRGWPARAGSRGRAQVAGERRVRHVRTRLPPVFYILLLVLTILGRDRLELTITGCIRRCRKFRSNACAATGRNWVGRPAPSLGLPQFTGKNPRPWKTLCQQYFHMFDIHEKFWVPMTSLNFAGIASV